MRRPVIRISPNWNDQTFGYAASVKGSKISGSVKRGQNLTKRFGDKYTLRIKDRGDNIKLSILEDDVEGELYGRQIIWQNKTQRKECR